MDEGSKHPESMESGQHNQRQVNHPRPFFYVQPASQPYYNMYHHNPWHNMNNPYSNYGLPGSGGYPFGRPSPYMSPYPYMQYPGGYVVPHAPHMHPVDYRRMYEPPHFHPPPVHDPMFRHQQQQQQQQHHHAHAQREVVCSEAQTDPSDALNKLIECLDKLRANETQGSERELDSGVVSQSSGIFSPNGERKSCEVGGDIHSVHGASCGKLEGNQLQSSFPMGRLFSVSDSTAVIYDGESSRRHGGLGQEGWAVDSDEEPPLDSSSVHEENLEAQQHAEEEVSLHRCSSENLCLVSAVLQSEDSSRPGNANNQAEEESTNPDCTSSTEGPMRQGHCSNLLSPKSLPSPLASDWQALEDTKRGEETFDIPDRKGLSKLDVDLPYQILHLPFDKVLTAGALLKDRSASSSSALLCGDLQASMSSSRITSSPARHHYYSYYCPPQTAHERLSVLSPSLDELSSRDEMFSTDLEDMDRFPRSSVYAGRRFSAEVDHLGEPEVKKVCPKSKKLLCACCGSSLLKGGASRVKVNHSPRVYGDDEAGDSDEVVEQEQQSARTREERAHPTRVVVQKHSVPKKHQLPHIQQHPKPSCKRGQCREVVGPEEPQEEPEMVLEYYEGHVVEGGQDTEDNEHRTCKDGLCREDMATSDPGRWESGRAKPRRKPHASLQERLALRKALWKPLVYQRARDEENDNDDEEEEPPRCHRGKDMEATVSTASHAFGVGPYGPNPAHGPQPGQGPRHPGHPGPYGVPRPEDQPPHQQHQQPHHHIQHSRPFFYIHPSQPYPSQPYPSQPYPSQPYPSQPYPSALPYQWPMPMPYNPYCSFPGMGGYGMIIQSPFQPSPYMEPPGYILPHSQLHLADYRRMINPHYHTAHYPQTMAYHARRFRYQHSAPATSREMISSEVQTEPPLGAARSDPKLSADSSMRSNVQTNSESGNVTSCTAAQSLSPASAVQEVMSKSPAYQDMVLAPTPNTRSAAPQKGSFVFQAEVEEVRMECRSTPTGLNILHSHETSELCTTHSVSGTDEDLVQLCSSASSLYHKASQGRMLHGQEGIGLVGEQGEQCLQQASPDILLLDGLSSSVVPEHFLALEDCESVIAKTLTERPWNAESDMDYRVVVQSHNADGPQLARNDGELSGNGSKSVHFKILHLPFDMQYLEELRKMEASVWSVQSLAPYIPSDEFMIQQGLMAPHREALSPVVEVPVVEVPTSEGVSIVEVVPVVEEVPTSEGVSIVEVVPVVEEVPTEVISIVEEVPVVEEVPTSEVISIVKEVPVEEVPTSEVISIVEEVPFVEEVPMAVSPMNGNVPMAAMVPNVVEVPAISSPNNAPMSPETRQRVAVSDLDHQDTSFGALPTYLPSTSWLDDPGNVYYYSKLPRNVEEQRKILRCSPLKLSSPKGKPDQEPKDPHRVAVTTTAPIRLKGEGCRLREKMDRRSYSDHECCANRTFNGNTVTSGGHKRERICARCLTTKCRVNKIPGSPGPGLDALIVKRQGVPAPPWEESILAQTCAACKCLPRRRVMRKGSGSDVPGGPHNEDTEGETSENSSCWTGPGPKLRDPRRSQSTMKRHSEESTAHCCILMCHMGPHSKLKEKNCSCEEPHQHGPPAAVREGQRRHHHGNVIRERNEENLGVCVSVLLQDKWRNQDQCYLAAQKWQQEKLWKPALSNPDHTESNISTNGPRHLIKQKKHISQSQGLHRKDTRC